MQDLTTASLTRHLLKTTSFMLVSMFQALYFLVNLYWVGMAGKERCRGSGLLRTSTSSRSRCANAECARSGIPARHDRVDRAGDPEHGARALPHLRIGDASSVWSRRRG